MVDQEDVTMAITVGRSVAQGDDAVAGAATVHLARHAGPDAVKFLRRVVVTAAGTALNSIRTPSTASFASIWPSRGVLPEFISTEFGRVMEAAFAVPSDARALPKAP